MRLSAPQIAGYAQRAGFRFDGVVIATALALAESGGDVAQISGPNTDGSFDYGLWQINGKAHPEYDIRRLTSDPTYNASAAFAISNHGNDFGPWTTYAASAQHPRNNNRYAAFLPQANAARTAGGIAAAPPPHTLDPGRAIGQGITGGAATGLAHVTGVDALASMLTNGALWKRVGIVSLGLFVLVLGFALMVSSSKAVQATAATAGKATLL